MTTTRRGLFSRLTGLIQGLFAGWLRDREQRSPRAVYENAIHQRVDQYRELKEAVAGILYMRNKLEAEIGDRREELARTLEDLRRAVRRSEDDLALTLIERKNALVAEIEHAEREFGSLRDEADDAKSNLVRFREEIRSLEHEKGRVIATLANAQARRRIQETLAGLSVDADVRALEGVREYVARVASEGNLEREIGGDPDLGGRLRALREEARGEAARRELAELKRRGQRVPLPAGRVVEATPA
jgi:phage shock protein A